MTQVAADPWASAYTIFDILNEPDSHGLGWQANGVNPGVGDLYHEVMTKGYAINPSASLTLAEPLPFSVTTTCPSLAPSLAQKAPRTVLQGSIACRSASVRGRRVLTVRSERHMLPPFYGS